jgi:hypothetical protein
LKNRYKKYKPIPIKTNGKATEKKVCCRSVKNIKREPIPNGMTPPMNNPFFAGSVRKYICSNPIPGAITKMGHRYWSIP